MPGTRATSFCWAICRPWTTTAVVCGIECSPQPENQPQPPSEHCISVSRSTPSLTIRRTSSSSNTGLRLEALPLLRPLLVVADFLGVQVRPLLLDVFQIELHVQQNFLGNHRRQEAVQRLLGAAVGIIDHVGQGIDHRAGQRGRVADFEPRLLRPALLRHVDRELAALVVRANRRRSTNPS